MRIALDDRVVARRLQTRRETFFSERAVVARRAHDATIRAPGLQRGRARPTRSAPSGALRPDRRGDRSRGMPPRSSPLPAPAGSAVFAGADCMSRPRLLPARRTPAANLAHLAAVWSRRIDGAAFRPDRHCPSTRGAFRWPSPCFPMSSVGGRDKLDAPRSMSRRPPAPAKRPLPGEPPCSGRREALRFLFLPLVLIPCFAHGAAQDVQLTDAVLIHSGSGGFAASGSCVFFGDGTGGGNGHTEVTSLRFLQGSATTAAGTTWGRLKELYRK